MKMYAIELTHGVFSSYEFGNDYYVFEMGIIGRRNIIAVHRIGLAICNSSKSRSSPAKKLEVHQFERKMATA